MKDIIIAVIGSGALAALVTGYITTQRGIQAGVRMMLYDRIKYLGCKYIETGCVSDDQLEDLTRMHEIYHGQLKGNGYLDGVMEKVNALPQRQGERIGNT